MGYIYGCPFLCESKDRRPDISRLEYSAYLRTSNLVVLYFVFAVRTRVPGILGHR